ncbi:ty3-gypsy retrotransposon protein [Tanacetum coccineum]
MKLSIMIDENKTIGGSVLNQSSLRTSVSTGNSYSNCNTGGSVTTRSQGFNKNNDATVKPKPFKRLTDAEFADKRAKGICFRCDDKFRSGNRCPGKTLQVLLVGDEDETEYEFDEKSDEHVHLDMVEVSLNSVMGFTSPHTMNIRGIIGDEEVVVLIDSGATHNFLSKRVLKELRLLVMGGGSISVMLGNRKFEKSRGICKRVLLTFPKLQFLEDFYPLDLGSTDVGMATKKGGFLVEMKSIEESSELSTKKPEEHNQILAEFEDVFHLPRGLPPHRDHEHAIVLKEGTTPISVSPYRYPYAQKNKIEKLVKEMLEAGVIQPSSSPFSSPVLLVKKKDGSWRFCVDYRALNKATDMDKFPIPVIDELLDELHRETIFSKLDLKSGYHQIRMKDEDISKTAFRTHEDHYEFLGVSADPLKIKAMSDWPVLKTLRELRGFLGLTGYYRLFVKGCGKIASDLTEQLKKDNFSWSEEATQSFKALKDAMTRVPVLALPDFDKEFVVESDASRKGVGAVLMHEGRPVAYFSQVLGMRARLKSVYERELMAIVLAIQKWRPYLVGTKLKRSTAYHPQTDGKSEVVSRSLEAYLRCFSSENPKQWARWLSWAEYWFSKHEKTNLISIKGRDIRPFEVEERIEAVAYKLKLPDSSLIHPVFHVSQLRRVIGSEVVELVLPEGLTEDMEVILQPEEVLGIHKGSNST